MALTDPEPAVVPVKVTKQLVTPDTVDSVQVGELRLPPVVPAVSVNATVPVAALEGAVVSATVAVTDAVQLVPPNAMLQLTLPTLVDVLSLPVTVRLILVGVVVAPRGEPVTMKLYGPSATDEATLIVKTLVAPAAVGVTGFTVKDPQVTPTGRLLLTQDNETGRAEPVVSLAVTVTVPELPCTTLTGPPFDNE